MSIVSPIQVLAMAPKWSNRKIINQTMTQAVVSADSQTSISQIDIAH
jgi:hypothetical protein